MINIAIVDDDRIILNRIHDLVVNGIQAEIKVDMYESSVKFYSSDCKIEYDVVFLDIDMPEMSGFEIADTLKQLKRDITIIFVSNLEHLVYESLRFRPFRFVRKSCLNDDVTSAIQSYITELSRNEDLFLIKNSGVSKQIRVADIIYFESLGHNIYVKTGTDSKTLIPRDRNSVLSIQSLLEQYSDKGFIRVHKSFLVNYRFIYVVKHSEIILKDNEKIYINPHKANEIRGKFQKFIMMEGV